MRLQATFAFGSVRNNNELDPKFCTTTACITTATAALRHNGAPALDRFNDNLLVKTIIVSAKFRLIGQLRNHLSLRHR